MKILLALCAVLLLSVPVQAKEKNAGVELRLKDVPVQVYFSPNGGGQEAIARTVGEARRSIFVQAYSFTSEPIARALLEAHKRGVHVKVILDKSQRTEKYTGATFLKNVGIDVFVDDNHAIAHNKVMIIDSQILVTGSFNFTKAAEERNAENLLIFKSPELASVYTDNWQAHRTHSETYERK